MLWIILSVSFIFMGVCIFIYSEYGKEFCVLPFILSVVVFVSFMGCRINWYKKYEEYKIIHINIDNYVQTIKQMKKTYYEPPKNIQFNLDMVNKELTKQINEKLYKLTIMINQYNNDVKKWNVSYHYRFWNSCPIQLKEKEFPILKLSDFDL
jgi:hypothetical protein